MEARHCYGWQACALGVAWIVAACLVGNPWLLGPGFLTVGVGAGLVTS